MAARFDDVMTKLLVAPHLIVDSLFKGSASGVRIVGASFNGDCVVLEIEGAEVPNVDTVTAVMSMERFRVSFCPVNIEPEADDYRGAGHIRRREVQNRA